MHELRAASFLELGLQFTGTNPNIHGHCVNAIGPDFSEDLYCWTHRELPTKYLRGIDFQLQLLPADSSKQSLLSISDAIKQRVKQSHSSQTASKECN